MASLVLKKLKETMSRARVADSQSTHVLAVPSDLLSAEARAQVEEAFNAEWTSWKIVHVDDPRSIAECGPLAHIASLTLFYYGKPTRAWELLIISATKQGVAVSTTVMHPEPSAPPLPASGSWWHHICQIVADVACLICNKVAGEPAYSYEPRVYTAVETSAEEYDPPGIKEHSLGTLRTSHE